MLRLEETRGLFQTLKTLFTQLGEVREADVFIGETLPSLAAAGRAAASLAAACARRRNALANGELTALRVHSRKTIETACLLGMAC